MNAGQHRSTGLGVVRFALSALRFASTDNVVATTLHDNETVLLHLGASCYYTLNETGSQIWQDITAGLATTAIEEHLTERYAVTTAEAHQAVAELLADLMAATLVQPVSDAQQA